MEKANEILEKVKDKVLADAISFVTILNVDSKVNFEGDIMLYITTDNLGTIELDKLKELELKFSDRKVNVSVVIPLTKFIKGKHVENKDSVNIFIREK